MGRSRGAFRLLSLCGLVLLLNTAIWPLTLAQEGEPFASPVAMDEQVANESDAGSALDDGSGDDEQLPSMADVQESGASQARAMLLSDPIVTIQIKLTDEETGEPLAGGGFTLLAFNCHTPESGEQLTGSDGIATLTTSAQGTHCVKQSTVPAGYIGADLQAAYFYYGMTTLAFTNRRIVAPSPSPPPSVAPSPSIEPSPSEEPSPSPVASEEPSPSPDPSADPAPSSMPDASPSPSSDPSVSPSPSESPEPTVNPSPLESPSPSLSPPPSTDPSPSPSPSAAASPSPSPDESSSPSPSAEPSVAPSPSERPRPSPMSGIVAVSAVDPAGGLIGHVCYEIYVDAGAGERGEQAANACDQPALFGVSDVSAANTVTFTGLKTGAYVLATLAPPGYLNPADRPFTLQGGDVLTVTVVVHRATASSPSPDPSVVPSPIASAQPSPSPSTSPSASVSPTASPSLTSSPSASPRPNSSARTDPPSSSSSPAPSLPHATASPPEERPYPSSLPLDVHQLPQTGGGTDPAGHGPGLSRAIGALLIGMIAAMGIALQVRGHRQRRSMRR